MLGPLPVGLLSTEEAPVFSGYDADYLVGVTNLPWTAAAPQGVSGGAGTWSVSPSLPTGLSINPVTGEISGTPTTVTDSVYQVTVTNSGGSASQNINIKTNAYSRVAWAGPATHTWKILNGVNNAYIRAVLCSGGGAGASSVGVYGGTDRSSGSGGGSGRRFTNLDYRPSIGDLPPLEPGALFTISLGAGGDSPSPKRQAVIYSPNFTFNSIPQAPYPITDGVNSIPITTGVNSGKTLVIFSSVIYALYDPITNTYGDRLTLSFIPGDPVTRIVPILSGTLSGQFLILTAGQTSSRIYNPLTHTVVAGPTLPEIANTGTGFFYVTSGIQSGKIFVFLNTTQTYFYDPDAGTFTAGHIIPVGAGFHGFPITSGPNTGKTLVVYGDFASATGIYDPATDTFSAGPSTPNSIGFGCSSTLLTLGPNAGKQLVLRGGSGPETYLYDHVANSFTAHASLTAPAGGINNTFFTYSAAPYAGLLGVYSDNGWFLVYDHTSSLWSTAETADVSARSVMIPITTGFYTGSYYLLRGGEFGDDIGFTGSNGGRSYVEIDGTIYSTFDVSGGGAAPGNEGVGSAPSEPGLAGGGNHGVAGQPGFLAGDLSAGNAYIGGYGANGFFDGDVNLKNGVPEDRFAYNTSPFFGGYPPGPAAVLGDSSGGGVYFLSSLYEAYDIIPPSHNAWGAGGGGGGIAFSAFGVINDFDYLERGNKGADGYFLLDWSLPDAHWVDF